ncbi:MAG: hypothetical protein KGL35_07700 [Bradyrhizobium sp.]|nr:hypothetical protein [Bradyrhizobium sp.]
MRPRGPAWFDRQRARTAELLAILDRPATPQELADALAIVSAARESPQPSLFCGRQSAA